MNLDQTTKMAPLSGCEPTSDFERFLGRLMREPYKHEFVFDWANWFCMDKYGNGVEFSHRDGYESNTRPIDYTQKWAYVTHGYVGMHEDSLQQREETCDCDGCTDGYDDSQSWPYLIRRGM